MEALEKKCTIDRCNHKHYARGWCRKHYRHVVEGKHVHPHPVITSCKSCGTQISSKAGSSGLCRADYLEKWKNETDWDSKKYKHDYYSNNKEKCAELCRKWRRNNRSRENAYYAKKRKCPEYRIAHNQRSRIYDALKGKVKPKKTMELIGCSTKELMKHLESQFQPGMSWDNYGTYWVVDHIKSLISFDLSKLSQLEEGCHYSNLQPLTYSDNSSKATEDKNGRIK